MNHLSKNKIRKMKSSNTGIKNQFPFDKKELQILARNKQ